MALSIKDVKKVSGGVGDRALANFSSNPAIGDVIVVQYAMYGAAKVPALPTDSQGNTYVQIGTQSGGASTQVVMYMALVTTGGVTAVTAHGTWSNIGVVGWLLTGTFSVSPYNGDFLTKFASTSPANVGPTDATKFYPGSLFLAGTSVATTTDLGDPANWNTEGVHGFTAAMHTAAKLIEWSPNEDLQTEYIMPAAVAAQSASWPNSTGTFQWAAQIASFAPPRVPLPTSVDPVEVQTTGGEAITITGSPTSFGAWVTGVTIGGEAATSVVVVDDQTITCVTPAHAAGAVDIVISGSDGDSAPLVGLTYSLRPLITGVSPQYVFRPGGDSVTITGSDFVAGATVTFNGVPATNVVVVNAQTITCDVPDGATGSCTITVTNP